MVLAGRRGGNLVFVHDGKYSLALYGGIIYSGVGGHASHNI